jgi:hypothetical protein
MIRSAAFLILLVPAACAAAPRQAVAPPPFDEDRCDAAAAGRLIGKEASSALGEEARQLSGAAMVRIVRPGDPVTSDYITSRINVDVGRDGRVTGCRCG